MSSEATEQLMQVAGKSNSEAKHEPRRSSKFSYTREFLLSLSELDVCKKVPAGLDSSILSEFEDASSSTFEWQRSVGGLSLLGSKRNDYGSASSNRVEGAGSYSRGSHGRWDTRSTGSSDRDGDTQNDRESLSQDSGRRYMNQSRRSWQKPEHDGLLGSGAFPRTSGYQGWTSGLKGRGDGNFQLNKSSEPYQPPRPYKAAPYSRKDNTDSYNDETFGSSECSSQDRAEEERKRRASFELMRKEQQKALQEKQKQILDKHKENFNNDIIGLSGNSEVDNIKSSDKLEEHAATLVSQGDFGRYSSHALASASRPLVPPGFASTTMEKNVGTQLSSNTLGSEVVNVGISDPHLLTEGSLVVNGEQSNPNNGNDSDLHARSDKRELSSIAISFVDAIEPPLTGSRFSDTSADCENTSSDAYYLLHAQGGQKDDVKNDSTEKKISRDDTDTSRQDHSTSILDKLFGNALTKNDDVPRSVEVGDRDEQTWSPTSSRSSKFASWFLEDDKRLAEDLSSRDLLSLIVSKNKAGTAMPDVSDEHIHPTFSFENSATGQKFLTSTAAPSIPGPSEFYYSDKPVVGSGVLTCEDLEQSMWAEVKENSSNLPDYVQGSWNTSDANSELPKANVDDCASLHLLSLLHKGTHSGDSTSFSNPEHTLSSGKPGGANTKSDVTVSFVGSPDNAETVNSESGKSLTLEALFGSAFMKELHSMEAPISQQRVSDGDCNDARLSQPHAVSFPLADNRFSSGEYDTNIIHKETMNHIHGAAGARLQKLEESRIGFEDSQTKRPNHADDVGHGGVSLEIHLPEEESLITVGDSVDPVMCDFFPVANVPKAEELLGPRRTNEIILDKLAYLSVGQNNEKSSSVLDAGEHGSYDMVELEGSYQNLHGQPSSSQFPYPRINHMRSYLQQSDNPGHKNPQMKFVSPENIHHDPQNPFYANIIHQHPLHNPGGPRLDPTFHHSMAQPMPMPGNFIPHNLQFFPRGVPLSHPLNQMPDYIPEAVHSFHRQPNYGGYGIRMPGAGVNGPGGHHPQSLGSLELNANSQQTRLPAAGHIPGIFGPELDSGFRYQ